MSTIDRLWILRMTDCINMSRIRPTDKRIDISWQDLITTDSILLIYHVTLEGKLA